LFLIQNGQQEGDRREKVIFYFAPKIFALKRVFFLLSSHVIEESETFFIFMIHDCMMFEKDHGREGVSKPLLKAHISTTFT